MVEALREVKPEVERLIQLDTISLGQFEYAKYNGCEIIP
jgi:hypothetical protein